MKQQLLLVLSFFLLATPACNEEKTEKKNISYLYLFDLIEKEDITRFEELLQRSIDGDMASLEQYQPEGYEEVRFTVYLSSNFDLKPIAELSLVKDLTKPAREERIADFIAALKKNMDAKVKDRYILRNLERMVSTLKDPDYTYEMIVYSELIENSGGAIRDGAHHEADFRFIDDITNGYFCHHRDFSAAQQQLEEPNSWISQHLIKNEVPKNNFSFTLCFKAPPRIDCKTSQGCNFNRDFWQPLFKKMGLNPQEKRIDSYQYLAQK